MQVSLGYIQPNSTSVAVQATLNLNVSDRTRYPCQAIQFQALASNTGSVYICSKQTPTLATDSFVEIPAPNASPATRPAWTVGNPNAPNPINAGEYWVLPAVSGEGVRITALIG